VLFPLDGESFWPRNSTHPVTSPNAFVVLTPCKSEPPVHGYRSQHLQLDS
jgi:hypothetical protein